MVEILKQIAVVALVGMVVAANLVKPGWRRWAASIAAGILLFAGLAALGKHEVRSAGDIFPPGIMVGLIGPAVLVAFAWFRENWWPPLRTQVVPRYWELAQRPPLSPQERTDRQSVTITAMAGASAMGLLVYSLCETGFAKQLLSVQSLYFVAFSAIVTWQSERILQPIEKMLHGEQRAPTSHAAGETSPVDADQGPTPRQRGVKLKSAVVVFATLVILEMCQDGIADGLKHREGDGIRVLVSNCLVAGVVTFYLASAVLYRAPSVAARAGQASITLGAVLTSPLALFFGLMLSTQIAGVTFGGPIDSSTSKGIFFGAILFGVLFAVYCGLLLFGLYAFAAGLAADRLNWRPAGLRPLVGLLIVAVLLTGLQPLLRLLLPAEMSKEFALSPVDYLTQLAMIAGWCLGLALDPSSERVLVR